MEVAKAEATSLKAAKMEAMEEASSREATAEATMYTEEQALGKRRCMRSEACAAESSTLPSCHHSEANSFPELDDVDLKEITNYNGLSNEDKAWMDDVEDASCSTHAPAAAS
mmetsp:Transcript_40683/g.101040  ORF Transcript_40683/g.101040 Transcript_40683/m.101040 type:complete len:112 (+) Transcript_40683:127-462(+)